MSSRNWSFRVMDIVQAINKIELYTENMTQMQFKKNDLVVDAVIRNFEIIGEASKNIPLHIKRKYPDVPWSQMNGMRNILIHEYFIVDLKTVWHTVKTYLPKLKSQLIEIHQIESD